MSLTRSLLNEFRPFFRLLDDPFYATGDPFSVVPRQQRSGRDGDALQNFWDTNRNGPTVRSPHVHLNDAEGKYLVEAELPGIKKENLDISIGDNGRSLTIKGHASASSDDTAQQALASASGCQIGSTEVAKTDTPEAQQPTQRWSTRSSFERTIWLPRPVDAQNVSAKLDHGILTLEIPKLQAQTQRIAIN
ncbi:hypothetical protein M407DRAFT_20731 [Tulasnella calospora MUT 4182]|uniref:SHSP domain-containing protein n=1 Tax=Tulasnella calospora MUT 4182 TaxID=1051891 RepID=A0A0C3M979_9AGAM|nr:hypothetical protein M407DRAFT_20731 [Tulasnella calospora MUT 4182]